MIASRSSTVGVRLSDHSRTAWRASAMHSARRGQLEPQRRAPGARRGLAREPRAAVREHGGVRHEGAVRRQAVAQPPDPERRRRGDLPLVEQMPEDHDGVAGRAQPRDARTCARHAPPGRPRSTRARRRSRGRAPGTRPACTTSGTSSIAGSTSPSTVSSSPAAERAQEHLHPVGIRCFGNRRHTHTSLVDVSISWRCRSGDRSVDPSPRAVHSSAGVAMRPVPFVPQGTTQGSQIGPACRLTTGARSGSGRRGSGVGFGGYAADGSGTGV